MTKRHCLVSENFVHRGDLNIRHSKSGHIHNLIQNFNVNGHLTGLDKMVLFANAVSVMSEKGFMETGHNGLVLGPWPGYQTSGSCTVSPFKYQTSPVLGSSK